MIRIWAGVCLLAATGWGQGRGKWMAGDFHQHTYFTDGSHPLRVVNEKGRQFGLGWQTNSEHGGGSPRDGEGNFWDDAAKHPGLKVEGLERMARGHRVMWRWQSLRDFAFPAIAAIRKENPETILITGLEWNMPGHEHCSTAIAAADSRPMAEFEYRFDANDADVEGGLAQGWMGKQVVNNHAKAVAAAEWLQKNYPRQSYLVPAHPERGDNYKVEDFRDLNNAAPDVAIGFEGLPGHQKETPRGGYGPKSAGGGTYGGAGVFIAKIGGVWDALLGEGRRWWTFVSSDFHGEKGDFWPGEYAKTWVFVPDLDGDGKYTDVEVIAGLRSGNSFAVHGDLVDKLEFGARRGGTRAAMGGELVVKAGATVDLEIRYRSPGGALHHWDLIAGEVGERVAPGTEAYQQGTNPTARQIARFGGQQGRLETDGTRVLRYRVRGVKKSQYFRLRGTNLAPGTVNETDAEGNPLRDDLRQPSAEVSGEQVARQDLWVYSNPVFVRVQP